MTSLSGEAVAPGESRGTGLADPSPCGAAGPAAPALPQRSCGSPPATASAKTNQPLADPEILRRVLDGLRQL